MHIFTSFKKNILYLCKRY